MPDTNTETLSDLIAKYANDPFNKVEIAQNLIRAAKKEGDPATLKIITQAITESQYKEVDSLPINDKRFEEIACLIADTIRAA